RQAVTNGRSLTFVGTLMNGPANVESRPFPQRHEGHRGYTMDTACSDTGISGQLVDQAIAGQKPQIILLMIGTNDINRSVDVANAPVRLGKLIDEIVADAPGALVVVSTIIPINDSAGNTRV